MDVVFDATAIVQRTSLRGPYGHASGDGNGDAGAQCRVNTPEFAFFSAVAAQTSVCFRAVCAITRSRRSGTLGVDAPDHEKAITSIWRRFSHIASRGSRETLAAERQASPLPCTWTGGVKDGTAKGHTSLVVVLAFACAANAGFAQTQATTTNGTQTSGDRDQSAAAMAQEAANPFSSRWLMQIQQNNNWMDMPLESGTRMQSNLMFQPLMSVPLSRGVGPLRASGRHHRQFLAPPRSERPA